MSTVPSDRTPLVDIVPLGAVDSNAVEFARAALQDAYEVKVSVRGSIPLPKRAYDEEECGYRGFDLLEELAAASDADIVLGVTGANVGHRRRWSLLGIGALDGRSAVVSTKLLVDDYREVYRSRVRKEAVKLVGRTLGFETCDARCALAHAKTVYDLDESPESLCPSCARLLRRKYADANADAVAAESDGRRRGPAGRVFDAVEDVLLFPLLLLFPTLVRAERFRRRHLPVAAWADEQPMLLRALVHDSYGFVASVMSLVRLAALLLSMVVVAKIELEVHEWVTGGAELTVAVSLAVFVTGVLFGWLAYRYVSSVIDGVRLAVRLELAAESPEQ
jgi:predicted Zn-dependent protease